MTPERATAQPSARRARPLPASLLAAALLLGQPPLTAAQGDGPAAALSRALAEAEQALARNEVEIAESRYRSALLEGRLLLGALAAEAGDLAAAREAFERASRSVADDRRALISLAVVELAEERGDEAASLLRRVLARDPGDLRARRLLARALVAAGKLDQAVQELEEVRALAPEDLEGAYTLATAYLRQGRPELAEPLFLELAVQRPLAETHVLIGRTYRDHGLHERAREALETALELDPKIERAHYYLGTIDLLAEGRGRLEEALAHFRRELEVAPEDPMANLYLGIGLVESRRYREAVAPLEVASRASISERDALQFLGRAQLGLDRPAAAVVSLERSLELAEAEAMERPDGVLVDLGESQLSTLNYQLAQALRRSGDEEAAAVHFARAKEHTARLAESSRELLSRYLRNEPRESRPGALSPLGFPAVAGLEPARHEELRRRLTEAVARAHLNLGVLSMQARQFTRAARQFAAAAELDPAFPRLQYSLGVALFNAERFEEAIAPLSLAREESPADATLTRMLALAWLNSGGYAQAAELLADDPERQANRSLEYAYALALVKSGRAQEAAPLFDRLVADHPDWPELLVVVAQAHAQQGDYPAAIRFLERAVELAPGVAEAHATLGDLYLRQGKLDEAERALRAELAGHPDDLRSRYTLATVLDLNRKPGEAIELLRSLLAARPRHANGRYLLGKILLAQGAAEEAIEQLEVAAELAPEDANIRYQLGQALQKLGRADEAQSQFALFRQLKQAQREEP